MYPNIFHAFALKDIGTAVVWSDYKFYMQKPCFPPAFAHKIWNKYLLL